MKELRSIADKFLKGESVYKPLRIIISLVLNLSIASFFFQKYCGNYEWFYYKDFNKILDFIFKGHFIIPASIYFIVYVTMEIICAILFSLSTTFRSIKWQEKATAFSLKHEKSEIENRISENQFVSSQIKEMIETPDWAIKLYSILKKSIPESDLKNLEKEIRNLTLETQRLFELLIKVFFTCTFYFTELSDYGWKLYVLTVVSILITEIILAYWYLILSVAPIAVKNISFEMEKLISTETK